MVATYPGPQHPSPHLRRKHRRSTQKGTGEIDNVKYLWMVASAGQALSQHLSKR